MVQLERERVVKHYPVPNVLSEQLICLYSCQPPVQPDSYARVLQA